MRYILGSRWNGLAIVTLSGAALLQGCGSSSETAPTASSESAAQPSTMQTASAETQSAQADSDPSAPASPEELMLKVVQLTATQFEAPAEASLTPIAESRVASADRSRHKEIVQLSLEVISQTHNDPSREQLFNNAVHYLSGSQLQLALEGDAGSEQELIDNAALLLKRDPKSLATIEANSKVVELAREKAERLATEDAATVYANQARLFATNFAQEPNRSAVTLLDAARWCDRRGYFAPAITCYNELKQSFGSTIFANQADGPIRRLSMLGQALGEFGGPTIDGGAVQRSHYNGQPMVVVFWDSRDPDLAGTFAEIQQARRSRTDIDIALIGVCLDEDERAAATAIEALSGCPQIYSSNPAERGRNNPLARFYGVQDTPTIWLIESNGIVRSIDAVPSEVGSLR